MKKSVIGIFLCLVVFMSSCSFFSKPKMSNGEVVQKVKELASEIDTTQWKILEVCWSEHDWDNGDDDQILSNKVNRIDFILMDKEGKLYRQKYDDVDLKKEDLVSLDTTVQ
ncbi:hypothetical protein [uncultured Bacteroides sp.]|uniref:hypothetical protein n=1 Tax=uncultured Bacteroides sp. TaxID=162156 RepID=UPI0026076105|nr:hypothetical protein [uncultured Bacteroides sp.]